MIFRLPAEHVFPDPELAETSGLLAIGGDLHPRRVMRGYRRGIFPWYAEDQPILWWSPDPRSVLIPSRLNIQRSLKKRLRQAPYTIRLDTAFSEVIHACGAISRPDQDGSWITADMEDAYIRLHELGYAHSAEAWMDGELVGGLYGVILGGVFFGESMFSRASDASKIAFVHLVRQLEHWGVELIDCQLQTDHLDRFGAEPMARCTFIETIDRLADKQVAPPQWSFDKDFSWEV